jgi:hypothetical protein
VSIDVKLSSENGVNGNSYEAREEVLRREAKIETPFIFSFDASFGIRVTLIINEFATE